MKARIHRQQHWKAMSRVDELIMIIPVVLNLKGNLEMNLSARLGTAANVGELDKPETRREIILGNLTLLQVQATVVSFVAACVSFVLGRVIPSSAAEQAVSLGAVNGTSAVSSGTLSSENRNLLMRVLLETRKPRPTVPASGNKISGPAEYVFFSSYACTCNLNYLLPTDLLWLPLLRCYQPRFPV